MIWKSPITHLLIALFAAGAVTAAAFTLPLGHQSEVIVRETPATEQVVVNEGRHVVQKFTTRYAQYSGVTLWTDDPNLAGRTIQVRILDAAGHERSKSTRVSVTYIQPADTMRLDIATTFRATPGEELRAEIAVVSGPPLHLKAIPRGDIALALTYPAALNFGARQGVLAGVIFFLGVVLIQCIPLLRLKWLAAGVLLVLIIPFAWGGFWFSDDALGIADWDYYFSLHENYRQSILTYHSFPFWNPYTCGGTAGLADPEFPLFSPTFALELLFGIPHGLRLAIYLSLAILSIGALLLAKRLTLSVMAALVVVLAAAFSSVSRLEIVEGHVNQFAAMWIPWIFWAWLGAYHVVIANKQRWAVINRWTFACAAFLALMFFGGGIYLLLYTALAFILLICLAPRRLAALQVTAVAAVWSLGLVAVKLLPVLAWLHEFKSIRYAASTNTLPYLKDIFLGRHLHNAYIIFRQGTGWQEYGAYVGPFIILLTIVALWHIRRRRIIVRLVVAVILVILFASTGPLLKPLFDHMPFFPRSTISRIVVYAVYALGLLAGIGIDSIRRRWPALVPLLPLLVGAIAVDLMSLDYQLSEQAFVVPTVVPAISPAPAPIAFTTNRFSLKGSDIRETRTYPATQAGYGTTAYCSVLGPRPMIQTIYDEGGGKIILLTDKAAQFSLVSWSPNRVAVKVDAPAPTQIVLNTNYAHGWLVNGQPAVTIDGRVGAWLPAGNDQSVIFTYHTPLFPLGLIITLITLFISYLYFTNRANFAPRKLTLLKPTIVAIFCIASLL